MKGKMFVLNHDKDDVKPDVLSKVVHSVENVIGSHDKLVVLPNTLQLRETSTEELLEIQMMIDNILEGRKKE